MSPAVSRDRRFPRERTAALYRSIFLSVGLLVLLSTGARADAAVEDDCLAADPRFSAEACAAALADGQERAPVDMFRLKAAEGNAELAKGEVDYALLDFAAAIDEVKVHGAAPEDAQYADVLALYAIAHLRSSDPAAALDRLKEAASADPRNTRLPILKTYADFASADAAAAVAGLDALVAASPNDQSLAVLRTIFQHWQIDPAAGIAACKKYYNNAECGAAALPLYGKDHAAADLVASILGEILRGDVRRMSREEAPGAWSDCEAPEPEYAGPGCDMILAGDITPEERYAAQANRTLAFLHNDDAGFGIIEAEHLIARVGYGLARPPENDPGAVKAHALLVQAHLSRGDFEEAGAAIDRALADQPDDPTYLALRGLIDLATGNTSDADSNLYLATEAAPEGGGGDVVALETLMETLDTDIAEGVAACEAAYPGARCGAEEIAAGDTEAALAAIATSINAAYLGDTSHPFTLIGVDRLP